MLSLGLDPSLTGFGWAVHDSEAEGIARVVRRGRFATPAKDIFVQRYMGLRECVGDLLDDHPEVKIVGVESPPFGESFSAGLYGLFLFVNEAVYTRRRDIVYFDPCTVKLLAKVDPKIRKGKMDKSDMVAMAKADVGTSGAWNHNEADAYLIAKYAARFWSFLEGSLLESQLSPSEKHSFTRTHTYSKGKRAGETTKSGLMYREQDRFFCFSELPK